MPKYLKQANDFTPEPWLPEPKRAIHMLWEILAILVACGIVWLVLESVGAR